MGQAQSYVERAPLPALAGRVRTVWIQRTGPRPYVQRNLPTGGVELQCPAGAVPRLVGPLTAASVQVLRRTRLWWACGSGQVRRRLCLACLPMSWLT